MFGGVKNMTYFCGLIKASPCTQQKKTYLLRYSPKRIFLGFASIYGMAMSLVATLSLCGMAANNQFHIDRTASQQFWTAAREQGKFNIYYWFERLKYRDNFHPVNRRENPFNDTAKNNEFFKEEQKRVHTDYSGGFIRKSEIKAISRQLGTSPNTLRENIRKMVKEGLLEATFTGWRMISNKRAAALLNVKLNRLKLYEQDKEILKQVHTNSVIKSMRKTQVVRHGINEHDAGTISCRKLAKRIGVKSAMTAIRMEKKLEAKFKLVVERFKPEKVCRLDEYETGMTGHFVKGGFVYRRPCNCLTPITQ